MDRLNSALSRPQCLCPEAMHEGGGRTKYGEKRTANNEGGVDGVWARSRPTTRSDARPSSTGSPVGDGHRNTFTMQRTKSFRVDGVASGRSAHRQSRARTKKEGRGRRTSMKTDGADTPSRRDRAAQGAMRREGATGKVLPSKGGDEPVVGRARGRGAGVLDRTGTVEDGRRDGERKAGRRGRPLFISSFFSLGLPPVKAWSGCVQGRNGGSPSPLPLPLPLPLPTPAVPASADPEAGPSPVEPATRCKVPM